MKTGMFSPLKVMQGVALTRVVSVAASLLAAAIFAVPADALAASSTNDAASAKPAVTKKVVHRSKKVVKEIATADTTAAPDDRMRKKRVSYMLKVRRHHGALRKVAFEPRSSTAFGLQEGPVGLALRSNVAYVIDQNTSETLFDKNSRAVVPIASITKLMTSMVVLDSKLPLTDQVAVTDDDRDFEKHTGSRLSVGSVLSREDMLHIALMASENRAAAALSRYYPGGRPAFIAAMNAKAKALGMTDTHFESPSGLTSHNVSTARDLVKMVNAAYQYPLIRRFSTDHTYTVNTGKRELVYNSTNALVRNPSWDIGLQKTGFINEAGECLVMQATIQGRPMIIVLLDSTGKYSRFADAARLRNWLDNGGEQRVTSVDAGRRGT
ncbi:MAG TPA: D-alanyl-D-alanine endopeptidase [Trinickia sp.]|jgi:D-alanyl-D-alanine endopeptidase (penicillin-binding protein 7)|nr:D-alanyl-D-alanine endopeptidase [Trinickia sp.]